MRTRHLVLLSTLMLSCGDDSASNPVADGGPLDDAAPDAGTVECPPGFQREGAACASVGGTTYFVRPDGGTLAQCDGKTDAAYPPAAGGTSCAWKHPFYALPPVGSTLTSPFAGGDLLVVASGSYAIGAGAIADPGFASCDPAGGVGYDCVIRPVPSGTAALPTRIVGAGFDTGCSAAPEFWGTWRTPTILDLDASSHVVLACLDITDHAACTRTHNSPQFQCDNEIGIVAGYAQIGIRAIDSLDVALRDLRIHGLDRGILAGRIGNWSLDRVEIRGNVSAGWDGDVIGDDHNTGPVAMRNGSISWSGCIEPYPNSAGEPVGCLSQDRGGYGDGLGTGATGGDWTFDHFDFHHNVSDGLDLLYLDSLTARVAVRNSHFEANAGNAIKIAGGGHTIENVTVVGNCGFFEQPAKWPDMVNPCRALGNAFSLGSPGGAAISMLNVSAWSEGDCMLIHDVPLVITNSVLHGSTDFHQPFENSCFAYTETPAATVTTTNLVVFGFKPDASGCNLGIDPAGTVGSCTDPVFVAGSTHSSSTEPNYPFDLELSPTSPFASFMPALGSHL